MHETKSVNSHQRDEGYNPVPSVLTLPLSWHHLRNLADGLPAPSDFGGQNTPAQSEVSCYWGKFVAALNVNE